MATPETLTQRQLNRATLARQMLLERASESAVAAVEQLAGMQAQEARPPFIGLWSRVAGLRREDVAQALLRRELVRATLMRGTIHLFSAADYAQFRLTMQPVLDGGMQALGDRAEDLDAAAVLQAAQNLLTGEPRPFNDIRALLQEQFPQADDRALGLMVRMGLPLVLIPSDHRWGHAANAAFGLAGEWLGALRNEPDSLAGLVRRYLAGFGPASVSDAQVWLGMKGLKPVFEAMRPELLEFRDERGKALFDLPDAPRPDAEQSAPVRFLPEFDNLLLSHSDRTRVIADEHRSLVYQKGNLRLSATILVDGVVSGMWRVERKRKEATLTITPFAPLLRATKAALLAEAETLVRFIEDDAATYAVTVNDV